MANRSPLTLLKIGGSVITDRSRDRPRILHQALGRVAAEIADGVRQTGVRLVLVHGAGSFGHPIVRRTGIHQGLRTAEHRIAMGETQRLQTLLNASVVRRLLQAQLPAFPFQASAAALTESGRLVHMDTTALRRLLDLGMLPVLYGVPAPDAARGCSILSGDQILARLCLALEPDRVLHGTNVRGLFTADPHRDPGAAFLEQVDLRGAGGVPRGLEGSAVTDVTGGLRTKVTEMAAAGVSCQVFDATVPGNVRRALDGEAVGTTVLCGPDCRHASS